MKRITDDAFDALVGDLYLAAIDQEAAERVAPALARMLDAGTAALWCVNPQDGAVDGRILHNFAPENIAAYAQHWHSYDPWTLPLIRSGYDGVIRGGEIIEDSTLLRHPFYAEYGVRTGHFHVMGALLGVPEGGTQVGVVAVQRPHSLGAFSNEAVALMGRLRPHARRAFQLDARLQTRLRPAQAARAALDAHEAPTIILDGAGRVLHANVAAERLDQACSVISLRRRGEDGRIAGARPADTAWLREAVARAASGGAGGARRLAAAGEQIYAAVVTPLPRRLAGRPEMGCQPGMALLVLRLVEPLPEDQRLEQLCMGIFDFTRAEAEAASMLATGRSPEEIAAARDVRVSTVRTLLTRCMSKTGAQNLRRLVILLASLKQ